MGCPTHPPAKTPSHLVNSCLFGRFWGTFDPYKGPGQQLVSFYHFIALAEVADGRVDQLREVRLKVFLSREGEPTIPSLYGLFRGADWQERETFDMFGINFEGHPHPKRLLMPEDWTGWPLRKDYVQPDFYEMQDAY